MDTLVLESPISVHLERSAIFGQNNTRFELRRWWVKSPKRWAAWLMANPSNAGNDRDDPTAQRVTHFARNWGLDGWIGVNVIPFISSTPDEAWSRANWEPDHWDIRDQLQLNLEYIERVARTCAMRVVAFGVEPAARDYPWLEQCLEAFGQPSDFDADEKFYCLGITQSGQPLHPMARGKWRVSDGAQPKVWTR